MDLTAALRGSGEGPAGYGPRVGKCLDGKYEGQWTWVGMVWPPLSSGVTRPIRPSGALTSDTDLQTAATEGHVRREGSVWWRGSDRGCQGPHGPGFQGQCSDLRRGLPTLGGRGSWSGSFLSLLPSLLLSASGWRGWGCTGLSIHAAPRLTWAVALNLFLYLKTLHLPQGVITRIQGIFVY